MVFYYDADKDKLYKQAAHIAACYSLYREAAQIASLIQDASVREATITHTSKKRIADGKLQMQVQSILGDEGCTGEIIQGSCLCEETARLLFCRWKSATAIKIIRRTKHGENKLFWIVGQHSQSGLWIRARETAEICAEFSRDLRDQSLVTIAVQQAAKSLYRKAYETARGILSSNHKNQALAMIKARQEQWEQAVQRANAISDQLIKWFVIEAVAGMAAEKKLCMTASAIAENLTAQSHRDLLLETISSISVRFHFCDQAATIAGKIQDPDMQSRALKNVAKELLRTKQLSEAKGLAAKIQTPTIKDEVMALIRIRQERQQSKKHSE